jgi:hypothetical protein
MVALSVGVRNMRAANPQDVVADFPVDERRSPQRKPILHPPARDHIVNRSERKALVIQMPVQHPDHRTAHVMTQQGLAARSPPAVWLLPARVQILLPVAGGLLGGAQRPRSPRLTETA